MALMDSVARIVYAALYNNQYLMCYFPYVLTWYFIFTAYSLALQMWIAVYTSVSRRAPYLLPRVRIAFVVLNLALLGMLLSCAVLWEQTNSTPDALYVAALVLSAVVISALFTFYGVKIARRLGAGRKMRVDHSSLSSSRDDHLYKVTMQIIMLSVTCCSGAVIALVAEIVIDYFTTSGIFADVIIKVLQTAFELAIVLEMLYMVQPKVKPIAKPIALNSSLNSASTSSTTLRSTSSIDTF